MRHELTRFSEAEQIANDHASVENSYC